MAVTLKDIIGLAKELPEECFEETLEKLREIKERAEAEKESKPVERLRCGSVKVVRNGKQKGRHTNPSQKRYQSSGSFSALPRRSPLSVALLRSHSGSLHCDPVTGEKISRWFGTVFNWD